MDWWVWGVLGSAGLILLALTRSQVNIGLRHALALYPLLALGSAAALVKLVPTLSPLKRFWTTLGLVLLIAWQVGEIAAVHPDHLAYFNPIAGPDPGAVLVDSDLDWGQGVFELETFFKDHTVDVLNIAYFGSARLCLHDLPELHPLPLGRPVVGWVAVSEFFYREAASFIMVDPCGPGYHYLDEPGSGWFSWLQDEVPVAILNRSIRVYHLK